ncbi:MAG: hypothetical protein GX448_02875, partial [Planctomycetes bacterium]|nr:hypothetical protein [Planctomycetota bacterium]
WRSGSGTAARGRASPTATTDSPTAPIFWFFNHKTWLEVQPQRVTGVFDVRDVGGAPYDLLDVRKLDSGQTTEDFFRVLKDPAVYGR